MPRQGRAVGQWPHGDRFTAEWSGDRAAFIATGKAPSEDLYRQPGATAELHAAWGHQEVQCGSVLGWLEVDACASDGGGAGERSLDGRGLREGGRSRGGAAGRQASGAHEQRIGGAACRLGLAQDLLERVGRGGTDRVDRREVLAGEHLRSVGRIDYEASRRDPRNGLQRAKLSGDDARCVAQTVLANGEQVDVGHEGEQRHDADRPERSWAHRRAANDFGQDQEHQDHCGVDVPRR